MDIQKLKKSQKGGLKKSDYSLSQFIEMFERISEADILTNLPKYIQGQIEKLEKIKKTLIEKIDDDIKVDYSNRRAMVENINSTIPGDGKVKNSYLESLNADVRDFMENIRNSNFSVQQIEEFISKFRAAKSKINKAYVRTYKEECIKMFKDNFENSDTLIAYKEELLEYLIIVLGKGEVPNQNPFCVVLTGSPGLGKSSLANQIVKLLKMTNLLPIGRFINVKKPDVIGQYTGHTAPKTYKILTSAIGSIAFIDEAYSFAGDERGGRGFDPFGKEFIDALVDFMEEYKGLISIVAAGYKEEMENQFFKVNTGLYRRFPIQLDIKELTAITVLKYLFDKKVLFDFLSLQSMRYFIQNFIRLAFYIEQPDQSNTGYIVFVYGYIDSDGTRKEKNILFNQNQSFMTHFFNENGLFSNNWTDVQILLDFLTNNIKLIKDAYVIIKNTIKGYLSTKIKNSNIEIKVELLQFEDTVNMVITLITDDNEADKTFKTFTSTNLKNNESEKTTERELFEYLSKNKKKFDTEPPEPRKLPKYTRSKPSSSASSASAASAASAAKPSFFTSSSSSNSTRSDRPSVSSSSVAAVAALTANPAFKAVGDIWKEMKYIIDNVPPDILYGNCYLENFIRTLYNLKQYSRDQVIYQVNYVNPFFGGNLKHTITAKKITSFSSKYFLNFYSPTSLLAENINRYVGSGIRKEEIITKAISDYLNTYDENECTVYIRSSDYLPYGYDTSQRENLWIDVRVKVNPPNTEPKFEDKEFVVDEEMDNQDRINRYKSERFRLFSGSKY
jgi:hypothetical protein